MFEIFGGQVEVYDCFWCEVVYYVMQDVGGEGIVVVDVVDDFDYFVGGCYCVGVIVIEQYGVKCMVVYVVWCVLCVGYLLQLGECGKGYCCCCVYVFLWLCLCEFVVEYYVDIVVIGEQYLCIGEQFMQDVCCIVLLVCLQ